MPRQRTLRVGTRGSALALVQTRLAAAALAEVAPGIDVETVILNTSGDADKHTPLAILGGQGIFVKELESALLSGSIDLAVHSAKDLSTSLPDGLIVGAWLNRADPRDVLLTVTGTRLMDLPSGSRVGTSSRRRLIQLRQARPDLRPVELRGNIDTRLRKLADGEVDAAIMAAAGIVRMGWHERVSDYLSVDTFVPPPGQGALGIECRTDDEETRSLLTQINDEIVATEVETERAFLRAVGGGCQSPVGARATIDRDAITLHAMLADDDLTISCYQHATGSLGSSASMAKELAESLQRAVASRLARPEL